MNTKTGRYAIIEQFLADGINYMFGNPGTVEQGFLDALGEYNDFQYILTLQESVAVGIADGYARATKRPTLVQLHSGVGLGNGIGMLYQAYRGHAPLVVITGEAGIKYDAMDAQMAVDLVSMAKPVTKWATRVVHSSSLLRVLRRAIKIAATPPMGPVFVCLPADVLDSEIEEEIIPTSIPNTRVMPSPDLLNQAVSMMRNAEKPLIIIGDGIAFSDACDELTHVADILGADVWGADSSEVNIDFTHPLYKGNLGHMFGANSSKITTQADVILVCGTYVFPEVFPYFSGVFAPDAKIIHIDLNPYEIAKNFPVDLGIVSDPKLTLEQMAVVLEKTMSLSQKEMAKNRFDASNEAKKRAFEVSTESDKTMKDNIPMHASAFMEKLSQFVPDDVVIFDEALTSSPAITRYMPPKKLGQFFQTRGGSLGVGIPGALGLKLAYPEKTVIGFTGDGGSMYTIQALWTAKHHNIGAKFVICNNKSYMLLKLNIMQYWREQGIIGSKFPESFNLADPVIDFVKISESMGIPAVRVETPEQIEPAIKQMLESEGAFLIDLIITDELPDSSSGK